MPAVHALMLQEPTASCKLHDQHHRPEQGDKRVEVRRFYRPEDISQEQAYKASFHEVYASTEKMTFDLDEVIGPCTVLPTGGTCGALLMRLPAQPDD